MEETIDLYLDLDQYRCRAHPGEPPTIETILGQELPVCLLCKGGGTYYCGDPTTHLGTKDCIFMKIDLVFPEDGPGKEVGTFYESD